MGALSPTHWLIIIGVLVLLFGAKRLPDAARSLGRSARILKAEVKETVADDTPAQPTTPPAVAPALPPAATVEPQPAATTVAPEAEAR